MYLLFTSLVLLGESSYSRNSLGKPLLTCQLATYINCCNITHLEITIKKFSFIFFTAKDAFFLVVSARIKPLII